MADTEAKKFVEDVWASSDRAVREDPETLGIDRTIGFPVAYEQRGTRLFPHLSVYNQRRREHEGAFDEMYRFGGLIPWDEEIDYHQYARVSGADGQKYIAIEANGPSHGNVTDPTASGQTVWRLH